MSDQELARLEKTVRESMPSLNVRGLTITRLAGLLNELFLASGVLDEVAPERRRLLTQKLAARLLDRENPTGDGR